MRMKRVDKGQEAIEFALITGIVFIAALGTIVVFGGKIANFFESGSAVVETSKADAPLVASTAGTAYTADYQTEIPYNEALIAGTPVNIYDDGHVVVKINGNAFTLNSKAVQAIGVAMEASGIDGLEDIVAELAYLAKTYNVKPEDIEVWAGSANRNFDVNVPKNDGGSWFFGVNEEMEDDWSETSVKGKAKMENTILNAFVIKVGDHMVIIEKDQKCTGELCPYQGTYRIEGDVDANGNFSASFTNDKYGIEGTYDTSLDLSGDSLVFEEGEYEQNKEYKRCHTEETYDSFWFYSEETVCDTASKNGSWSLDFSNSSFKFSL